MRNNFKLLLKLLFDRMFVEQSRYNTTCPWCGNTIKPSQPVTLRPPQNPEEFEVPDNVTVYTKDPLILVGCSRCGDAWDFAGRWVKNLKTRKGEVMRVQSIFERAVETGKTQEGTFWMGKP